jgi:hypothetical protein
MFLKSIKVITCLLVINCVLLALASMFLQQPVWFIRPLYILAVSGFLITCFCSILYSVLFKNSYIVYLFLAAHFLTQASMIQSLAFLDFKNQDYNSWHLVTVFRTIDFAKNSLYLLVLALGLSICLRLFRTQSARKVL